MRSTFIVGFPGETEEDFAFLLDWLKEAKLDARRLLQVRAGRRRRRQRARRRGSRGGQGGALASLHGGAAGGEPRPDRRRASAARIDVIIDEVDEEGAIGRSKWDAPEIDGSVFLNGAKGLAQGDIVRARIVASDDYDVWAEVGA